MQNISLRRIIGLFFACLLSSGSLLAQFEEGQSSKQTNVISCNQAIPSAPNTVSYTTLGENSQKIRNIVRLKINELALSGAPGTPYLYMNATFTANVTLKVELWLVTPTGSQAADQTQTPALTVNYDPAAGNKYIPVDNLLLNGTTNYQQVRVTITAITITGLSNGWTSANVLPLLTVENEMRTLRYFALSSTPAQLAPSTITGTYDAVNHSDQLAVAWAYPVAANTNSSQLEYAWVENETKSFYNVNGVFDPNTLFWVNSTRIDIDPVGNYYTFNYNVPLLFPADPSQGGGTLYYRVRPVLKKNDGSLITGPWSTAQTFASATGHQPNLNWQSTTTFAENAKSKTVIQYFDGSLRGRQTVTKDNNTGNTIVAETIYDMQGRPNVQILPTPTLSTAIQYFSDFNRFNGQTTNDDPAKYFDLSVAGAQCNGAPALDTTRGNGQYYSANNPWIGTESTAKFIPDAGGYGYTETRYTDDPTERVSVQGGAGRAHQIGNGHETKYYYGKPTQNELDALFGTEAGDASHYFKNMVQDANGQMSVSYVDMHGRTVATALAGASPGNLSTINNNPAFYPASSGSLTDNLLTPATNIVKGDSIESLSTILVPAPTIDTFYYQLNPAILQQMNCNSQQVCFDCKYNLEISIRPEDCSGAPPIVKHYNNLQIVAANQSCGTSMGFIGDNISTPTTLISFTVPLGTGSWIVRKTLSLNDSLFKVRQDSALSAFLCKTQQNLIDSVFSSMSASTSCNTPAAAQNCTTCQAQLGSYPTYKTNYLASVGGVSTLTDAAIHAQYTQDSLACANACGAINPAFSTLGILRMQMLNDMIPYSGQYALPIGSVAGPASLEAKYNIFMTSYTGPAGSLGTKPLFRNPAIEPNAAPGFYANPDGTADIGIYPSGVGTDLSVLSVISNDSFATIFNRNWASQLIVYHPEYSKLHYAETTLASSFAYLDAMMNCNTYATASANGYLTPLTSDPYFVQNFVPGDKTAMSGYLTSKVNASASINYSIWLLANGSALCDSTKPPSVRNSCMAAMLATNIDPSAATTAQKDAVWKAFRSLYLGYRNDMVMKFIDAQQAGVLSAANMTELQTTDNKILRFATAQTQANQNDWTWWASATRTTSYAPADSVAMTNTANAYVIANTLDQCTAQRPYWQARLMQCEQLQQFLLNHLTSDTVKVNTMIGVILDSMVMVCHNSINNNNPSGASNVNPAVLPVVPANFENIINHVFTQYNVATLPANFYFCNPYSIDYPKPYNSNPALSVQYKQSVDTCNCNQFAALKTAAAAAGYNANSFASMDSFLLANYNDTLSLPLWQGLQSCNGNNWFALTCTGFGEQQTCVSIYENIALSTSVAIPTFLDCGYTKPCISCATLQSYTAAFRLLYPAYAGAPYTGLDASVDTGLAKQNALWARYLNYKTGFSKAANEYITAFLNCGLDTGEVNLVLTDRVGQPPLGLGTPLVYSASSSIVFSTGYTSLSDDNFTSQTAGYLTGSATALCALDKPVTFVPMPDTTHSNPCQQVHEQAEFIGIRLFQQQHDSLIAKFDSLYRAKCLGAQSIEVFYAKYAPSEYHYTLYYYDQAGNLVKTLAPAAVQPNYNATYLASVQTARAAATDLSNGTNIENMATQYRYNTLNQVMAQKTPDAGVSNFWYDRLGRLAVSQNAKQASTPTSYSYTIYDALGRITEVGQKPQTTAMTQTISQDTTGLLNWLSDLTAGGTKVQITRTVYDAAYPFFFGSAPVAQLNLRNRVSYSQVFDADNADPTLYRAASYYSYDIHGNVDTLLQDYGRTSIMGTTSNRFKLIRYDFDLISGKVNQVSYQPGQMDAFYHQYSYDAENRLTAVRTSTDSLNWQSDASYTYYRHGPLARTQLGDLQVEGVDYAYSLQGWLKAINPSWITDPSTGDQYDQDGTGSPALFARDAYKLNLNYFDDGTYTDYKPIAPPTGYVQGNGIPSAQKTNLYNGNIGSQAVNIRKLAAGTAQYAGPLIYNYHYDQLNRITSMDAWAANGIFAPTGTSPMPDYAERFGYDPNGNILTLSRNGTTGTGLALGMDNLSYQYIYAKSAGGVGEYVPGQAPTTGVDHLTNQLGSIRDAVTSSGYNDIKNQSALNYQYDAIGNLTADAQAQITNITWSVYGKILSITDSGKTISYTYDPSGNRISKIANGITTWYVRDASGNVMSVYAQGDNSHNAGAITQTEGHVYGSSRLGILNLNVNCTSLGLTYPLQNTLVRGNKLFELTNHLGNVLVTISDKKLQHSSDNSTVDYYNPDVITAGDYYAFGMPMPGRSYNNANYRYGFNGKEQDNEVKGTANEVDYGMRIYDPRVGRFLSVDPLTKKYPWYTPYQYAGNKPVWKIDIDGLEETDAEADRAEKEELLNDEDKEEQQARLRRALREPTKEEKDKARKEFDKFEKDPAGSLGRFREAMNNYVKNGLSSAQNIFGTTPKQTVFNFRDANRVVEAQKVGFGETQARLGIVIPGGIAEQSLTKDAYETFKKVIEGSTLYRIGTLGISKAGEAQYWSLENPADYLNKPDEFAAKFGIPAENLKSGQIFIEAGKLNVGSSFITRPAPGVGANKGGSIEVVTNPGSVKLETFNVIHQ